MAYKQNIKVENGKKTAANLIKSARKVFRQRGYKDTSMEEVVHVAGVTRGALYHHFQGKEGLFLAVFEDALVEITDRCKEAQSLSTDPWDNFIAVTRAFFEACIDPEVQQIVLIDAPAILGMSVWRKSDEKKTMVILKEILTKLINQKVIKPLPLEALAHSIWGATSELVIWISHTGDPRKSLEEGFDTIVEVFKSLKLDTK